MFTLNVVFFDFARNLRFLIGTLLIGASAMLIGGTSFLTKNSLSKPKIRQSEILRISPIRSLQGDTHQERSNTNPGIPTSSVNMYITAKY